MDDVDRHDHHREGTYPLAHNPVTSLSVSGPVRVPLGLRLDRRYEELPQWEAAVAQHVSALPLPREKTARQRLQKQGDPVLFQEPELRARHAPFRTTLVLAIAPVDEASGRKGPCGGVVFAAWSLAEDVVRVLARRRQDWSRLLHTNRGLETASLQLRDVHGWVMQRPGPQLAVEDLVPLIPAKAYRAINVRGQTDWCFPLGGRIAGLGKGRIVVSCEAEALTGRSVVLVTNRVDWSAAKIISLYLPRWPTDTFSQDSTGPLGFNASRMRRIEAMGTHGGVVFVASSLRHLTCLPAGADRTQGLIHTMGAPVGNKGARCVTGCWCSSTPSCPTVPRLTISLRRYAPSSGAW